MALVTFRVSFPLFGMPYRTQAVGAAQVWRLFVIVGPGVFVLCMTGEGRAAGKPRSRHGRRSHERVAERRESRLDTFSVVRVCFRIILTAEKGRGRCGSNPPMGA